MLNGSILPHIFDYAGRDRNAGFPPSALSLATMQPTPQTNGLLRQLRIPNTFINPLAELNGKLIADRQMKKRCVSYWDLPGSGSHQRTKKHAIACLPPPNTLPTPTAVGVGRVLGRSWVGDDRENMLEDSGLQWKLSRGHFSSLQRWAERHVVGDTGTAEEKNFANHAKFCIFAISCFGNNCLIY